MSKPSQKVMRLPIEQQAEIAFKAAVAKAIDEHARLGLLIYVWRKGQSGKAVSKGIGWLPEIKTA